VVDCKVTQPAHEPKETAEKDGSAEPDERRHAYSRRMEFVQSAQLAQTEVHLQCRPASWKDEENVDELTVDSLGSRVGDDSALRGEGRDGEIGTDAAIDATRLHMPVHRVLASLCVDFLTQAANLQQEKEKTTVESHNPFVAVIGAGCCALPSYLQTHALLPNLTVHAVEPSAEVLEVAARYFGASFTADAGSLAGGKSAESGQGSGSQVFAHCMDGSQYLRMPSAHKHDVIIIDAFADAQDEESSCGAQDAQRGAAWGLCAPPQALLQDWPQLHAALTRDLTAPPGLLLMNVYGPAEWVDHVARRVEESALFYAPIKHEVTGQEVRGSEAVFDAPGTVNSNVVLSAVPKVVR
jgi:hypothetical protein